MNSSQPKMEDETTHDVHADSESDESDTEEGSSKAGSRDSTALLDTWLAELDSLTTVPSASLELACVKANHRKPLNWMKETRFSRKNLTKETYRYTVLVQMHRIIYHWDIKNFDRICTPENEEFEPILSNPFKAGAEIGRESEWELILSAESGYLQIWLYLKKIFTELIKEISVHLTVMIMKADGTTLLRRRCDKNQMFTPEDNGWGMGYIITIETLWDEREVYLADNTLRLRIQLDILGELVSRYKRPSLASKFCGKRKRLDTDGMEAEDDPSTALLKKDFRRLLKSHNGADFTIECDGKNFPVHKAILTARSKVFDAMLKHDTIENRSKVVRINDMTASAVAGMLDYIYIGDIRHTSDMDYLINLVEASDKYELTDLKNQCFKRLCEKISNETIGKIAIIAYMHNAEVEVLQEIRTYSQSNWDSLMKLQSFKDCIIASPRAFFEDIKGDTNNNSSCDESK